MIRLHTLSLALSLTLLSSPALAATPAKPAPKAPAASSTKTKPGTKSSTPSKPTSKTPEKAKTPEKGKATAKPPEKGKATAKAPEKGKVTATEKNKGKEPPPPPPEAPTEDFLGRAQAAWEEKNDALAESLFRDALREDPALAAAHYGLGRVQKRRGDCAAALASFAEARTTGLSQVPRAELEANETECRVILAEVFVPPQASATTEARVARQEGILAYERGDLASAEKALARAISARPEDAEAYFYRGLTASAQGRDAEAVRALFSARQADPALSFTTPERFRATLARAQARAGMAPGDAPRPILRDAQLDPLLAAMRHDLDERGLFLGALGHPTHRADQAGLGAAMARFATEHQARPALIEVGPGAPPVEALADTLWEVELRRRPGALLLVSGPDGVAVRTGALDPAHGRALSARLNQEAAPLQAALTATGAAYREQQLASFLVALGAALGAALLLGVGAITARRQVQARRAKYGRVLDRLDTLLPAAADALADARLALRMVPADEIEDLLEAGEQLFFAGRDLRAGLPSARLRRPPQALAEEALFSVEEAERKAHRALRLLGPHPPQALHALGCFFCARPIGAEAGGYPATVTSRGVAQEVLACRGCERALAQGAPPPVLMVLRKGRRRHWSQTKAFAPRYDFYRPRLQTEWMAASDAWVEIFGDEESLPVPPPRPITSPGLLSAPEVALGLR